MFGNCCYNPDLSKFPYLYLFFLFDLFQGLFVNNNSLSRTISNHILHKRFHRRLLSRIRYSRRQDYKKYRIFSYMWECNKKQFLIIFMTMTIRSNSNMSSNIRVVLDSWFFQWLILMTQIRPDPYNEFYQR